MDVVSFWAGRVVFAPISGLDVVRLYVVVETLPALLTAGVTSVGVIEPILVKAWVVVVEAEVNTLVVLGCVGADEVVVVGTSGGTDGVQPDPLDEPDPLADADLPPLATAFSPPTAQNLTASVSKSNQVVEFRSRIVLQSQYDAHERCHQRVAPGKSHPMAAVAGLNAVSSGCNRQK